MDRTEGENASIAQMYEQMMNGNTQAIVNLRNLETHQTKKQQSVRPIENQDTLRQNTDCELNKAVKSENLKSYIKEKFIELRKSKNASKKQVNLSPRKSEQKEYKEPKPFSVQKRNNEVVSEKAIDKSNSIQVQVNARKPPKTSNNAHKMKVVSRNFERRINKDIIKDEAVKEDRRNTSTPNSSKNGFRVRSLAGNKKLTEDLLRINEQERKFQTEILEIHNSSKSQIEYVLQKHQIQPLGSLECIQKPMSDRSDQLLPSSPYLGSLSRKSNLIRVEQEKITQLKNDLKLIDDKLAVQKRNIEMKEAKTLMCPLLAHLTAVPDIFEERQSEQENEAIDEVQIPNPASDPARTYQNMMTEMRKKKWGLNQRMRYEHLDRTRQESQGPRAVSEAEEQLKMPVHECDQGQNKIMVNSRLKQFLFD